MTKGSAGEVLNAVREGFLDEDPCDSPGACLHTFTMSSIVIIVGLAIYITYVFGKRKSDLPETPVTKDDFTGNMEPVKLTACPGGFGSMLCFVSYFCQCCLRVEL